MRRLSRFGIAALLGFSTSFVIALVSYAFGTWLGGHSDNLRDTVYFTVPFALLLGAAAALPPTWQPIGKRRVITAVLVGAILGLLYTFLLFKFVALGFLAIVVQAISCWVAGGISGMLAVAVVKRSRRRGPRMDIEIPRGDRCLSPSDFGFHNALLAGDGRLRFIDFEYAGWDDPAKMVCDFFWQPGIPVPLHFFDLVVQRVAQFFSDAALPARIGLLLPVYQVKWCCILLNDFLPLGRRRRSFAGGTAAQQEQRARQLQKARQALQNLV